mmetsp:Transcript_38658/g.99930  ORF Transcript_38658/g.99930 Transcript_38658/m.99930 type:complete len:286 (-) Transcript_38658:766-1623(-)
MRRLRRLLREGELGLCQDQADAPAARGRPPGRVEGAQAHQVPAQDPRGRGSDQQGGRWLREGVLLRLPPGPGVQVAPSDEDLQGCECGGSDDSVHRRVRQGRVRRSSPEGPEQDLHPMCGPATEGSSASGVQRCEVRLDPAAQLPGPAARLPRAGDRHRRPPERLQVLLQVWHVEVHEAEVGERRGQRPDRDGCSRWWHCAARARVLGARVQEDPAERPERPGGHGPSDRLLQAGGPLLLLRHAHVQHEASVERGRDQLAAAQVLSGRQQPWRICAELAQELGTR